MARVRVLILRTAGTNCDLETEFAWTEAGAAADRVHLQRVIERPQLLDDYQVLTLPGGFSYGDDISAGRIFAHRIEQHLDEHLRAFAARGGLILGICNGFQVLVKAGLLPFVTPDRRRVMTIAANEPPGFQDRWVRLEAAADTPCVFLEPGRRYEMPIAHGEGRVVLAAAGRERLRQERCDALRYVPLPQECNAAGMTANPNGSEFDLAGVCDATGRVLGLMPHPERFVTWTQHPAWSVLPPRPVGDGLALFQRAVGVLRE